MKRYLIYAGAIVAGLALAFTAVAFAKREIVRVGNLYIVDNGGIFPSKLPRHESVPIKARLKGKIGTLDGSHPPAVQTVTLDVDRTIGVDAASLPTCTKGKLVATSTAAAKRTCASAMLGSGTGEVEVEFPEQAPFSATGPVLLFNGGVQGGVTTVLVHTYVSVPAPTAVIVVAKLTPIHQGRFGLRIDAQIPRIAGGAGSITRFQLTIGREYADGGKPRSYLTASCPTGHYVTRGHVDFVGGARLGLTHVFPCTPE
jgi:hypothetical protein